MRVRAAGATRLPSVASLTRMPCATILSHLACAHISASHLHARAVKGDVDRVNRATQWALTMG
eukprot:6177540-Pleurochrysis_carterae.AAC.1